MRILRLALLLEVLCTFTATAFPVGRMLPNGVEVPEVALGVGYHGSLPPNAAVKHAHRATLLWLASGGSHIDTAFWYNDQSGVGSGWKSSGRSRQEVFITTKLPAPLGANYTFEYFANATAQLQTDYIDLYLFHTPSFPNKTCPIGTWADCRRESWGAMERLYKSGKIRALGVSNWAVRHLRDIEDTAQVMPMVNQVEIHPFVPNSLDEELPGYCHQKHIMLEAYSPLAGGAGPGRSRNNTVGPRLFHDPKALAVAAEHRATVAQVVLKWHQQLGRLVVVRSENATHMLEDLSASEITLSQKDLSVFSDMPDLKRNGTIWGWDLMDLP